jgi:siroheme synthase
MHSFRISTAQLGQRDVIFAFVPEKQACAPAQRPLSAKEDSMSRKFGLPGRVFLLGPVAGSADSLDARALAILQKAEVVLYDEAVSPEVLREVPKSSMVLNVGRMSPEQINERLIAAADEGKTVVRLKADANGTAGSAEDDANALREAGIEFEVVAGLTAAAAA